MERRTLAQTLSRLCYRALRQAVRLCYPTITLEGVENLPPGACILAGNHCQLHGPIIAELYVPGKRAIWCSAEMMHLREVPAYAYRDFWRGKPRRSRWLYRLLSYGIAPLSVCIFNNAHTIAVRRDGEVLATFRQTLERLDEGCRVVIFPEGPEPHNAIVNRFQEGFADLARLYRKRTGDPLPFVPMYVAPRLRKVYFGKPVFLDPALPREEARSRLCAQLMDAVTEIAVGLPRHTVIPYANVPKNAYPTNVPCEAEQAHEKASR